MKTVVQTIYSAAVALLLLMPSQAFAENELVKNHHFKKTSSANDFNLLEGVALNDATPANRTITLQLAQENAGKSEGFSKLRVSVFFTHTAATTVTAVFKCSTDGTNYPQIASRSCSAGTCTVSMMTDSLTTGGADADFQLEYDVRGCLSAQVLFAGASAGASDLVDVQAVAIAGK